jgi:hypothetical protein
MGDITGVRFVVINGDFRSDWLWLDETGQVTTYINNRGTGKGSLAPDWVSVGVTHAGMQVDGAKDRVKFGNVYPGNDNGADYVYIEFQQLGSSTGAEPVYDHYLHVWKNTGSGGTKLKGDGDFYCDMRGTGADDYVSQDSLGQIHNTNFLIFRFGFLRLVLGISTETSIAPQRGIPRGRRSLMPEWTGTQSVLQTLMEMTRYLTLASL